MKVVKSFGNELELEECDPGGYVYFISCDDYVKIGKSSNPSKRVLELGTGNPFPLELIYLIPCKTDAVSVALESHLHDKFRRYRWNGEWFGWSHSLEHILEEWAGDALDVISRFCSTDEEDEKVREYIAQDDNLLAMSKKAAELILFNMGLNPDTYDGAYKMTRLILNHGLEYAENISRNISDYIEKKTDNLGRCFLSQYEFDTMLSGKEITAPTKSKTFFWSKAKTLCKRDFFALRSSLEGVPDSFYDFCDPFMRVVYSNTDIKMEINRLAVSFGVENFNPLPIAKHVV